MTSRIFIFVVVVAEEGKGQRIAATTSMEVCANVVCNVR